RRTETISKPHGEKISATDSTLLGVALNDHRSLGKILGALSEAKMDCNQRMLSVLLRDCVVISSEPFDELRENGIIFEFTINQSRSW
ncbi:MAG TPA: hypothetical protein VLD83_14090, partial [Candidatus Binatia bacterium]|nr:hypothetical protein [Candidatus Binatia bacterium]